MSNSPDWIWKSEGPASGGTYQMDGFEEGVEYHSGPIPFDQVLPDDDPRVMFYVDSVVMPMDSKLARYGVKSVQQQVATSTGDLKAIIHIRRGLFGWFTKRWLRDHPLQLTGEMYRPEWGEWRDVTGKVEVLI